jgi:hypothetical protein
VGVTLSGGIRPKPGDRVLAAGPERDPARLPAGAPVAVGPAAAPDVTTAVLESLRVLVEAGGALAAGADVDLGGGYRSARIDGGPGDRRDAVLAALAVPESAGRLGPPPALLVALFGPAATKPLGAATLETVAAGRWPVLRFAVAASDLLGPEQLVDLLALRAPEGVDPFPAGLPSAAGAHLARVLRPLSGARRLRLLTDLWEHVCGAGTARARRERLRASQRAETGHEDLRARAERFEQDEIVERLQQSFGREPTLAQAALWSPPPIIWTVRAARVVNDALAATVLARLALSAVDLGLPAALARHSAETAAAAATLTRREAAAAARAVPSLSRHPARPACYLRDLQRLPPGVPLSPKRIRYVRERLAVAFDYGTLALENARDYLLDAWPGEPAAAHPAREAWKAVPMGPWREQVGYFSPARLPAPEPETVGDCLWYAELADALAQLRGHPAAEVTDDEDGPYADPRADPPADPLMPRTDSIALAAAGTAQLAELGGIVGPRPRTWAELVGGLLAGVRAEEARPGRFAVPEAADAADGTLLPGTDARIEIARSGGQLTAWAGYMGNCIAGPEYAEGAAVGRQVLVALRGPDGRIRANAEIRLTGKGWRLGEMKARFNDDPEPALAERMRELVASLPPVLEPAPAPPVPLPPVRRTRRPVRAAPTWEGQLEELASATPPPSPLLAEVIAAEPGPAALVALRRSGPAAFERGCRRMLLGGVPVAELWEASAYRPLSSAVAELPASARDRLGPLGEDVPLPRSLRRLARLPRIAPARNAELAALRVRAALGALIRADALEVAQAMGGRPHGGLLKAGVLAVTSWGGLGAAGTVIAVAGRRRIRVPGYPLSTLRDETWEGAWGDAVELGGARERFWDGIARHGLLVPASWLSAADWPVLWARAARIPLVGGATRPVRPWRTPGS